ncbi:hypothetical protein PHET_01780 [Paragonimus heterotremus]|uniref:Transmembrane protein n=1 Tax=Paragonimus heterotremus TaxID=100268 RepID=A0A8J4WIX9_9TREM|nr:hypothetical protein PHET_01780 [Paragonimus heterotremus]
MCFTLLTQFIFHMYCPLSVLLLICHCLSVATGATLSFSPFGCQVTEYNFCIMFMLSLLELTLCLSLSLSPNSRIDDYLRRRGNGLRRRDHERHRDRRSRSGSYPIDRNALMNWDYDDYVQQVSRGLRPTFYPGLVGASGSSAMSSYHPGPISPEHDQKVMRSVSMLFSAASVLDEVAVVAILAVTAEVSPLVLTITDNTLIGVGVLAQSRAHLRVNIIIEDADSMMVVRTIITGDHRSTTRFLQSGWVGAFLGADLHVVLSKMTNIGAVSLELIILSIRIVSVAPLQMAAFLDDVIYPQDTRQQLATDPPFPLVVIVESTPISCPNETVSFSRNS